jgi:hypothetical protein
MQHLPFRIALCVALLSANATAYSQEPWFELEGAGIAAPKPDRH